MLTDWPIGTSHLFISRNLWTKTRLCTVSSSIVVISDCCKLWEPVPSKVFRELSRVLLIILLVVVYLGHDESVWYLNLKALQPHQVQRDHLHYLPLQNLHIQNKNKCSRNSCLIYQGNFIDNTSRCNNIVHFSKRKTSLLGKKANDQGPSSQFV